MRLVSQLDFITAGFCNIVPAGPYSVTAVDNGTRALAIYQDFDLIVSDVGLPDISGIEICKAIRNKTIKRDIPIIALTANNYNEEIAQASFTEFMNKPVMQELLKNNVQKCLAAKKLMFHRK